MLSSEFQSPSIKTQDSKLTLLAPRQRVKILDVILGMSYNLAYALTSEYQSPSIKIEDFKINTFNPLNPISTKGG